MLIDLTVRVTEAIRQTAEANNPMASFGHLGTHFDVMNKEFPLDFTRREAIVLDVSGVAGRDIEPGDVDLSAVRPGTFVAFYSGYLERVGYGTGDYFREHPQLSGALIDALLARQIAIIGIDFAGLRRGAEHTPTDQYCADRGVFVVENLCSLGRILQNRPAAHFVAHTYPVNFAGTTGLPCRVVGEIL